jgi:hypothetical protein
MALDHIPPLNWNTPLVDPKTGFPSSQFMILWQQMFGNQGTLDRDVQEKAAASTQIIAGTGLTGGGDLSADRTLDLADTAVTPGTYGSSTKSAVVTIDQQGRLTEVTEASIAGGGGGPFIGVFASPTAATGNSDKAKGCKFTVGPNGDQIAGLWVRINANGADTFTAHLVEMSSATAYSSVVTSSTPVTPSSGLQFVEFDLAATLTASTDYGILISSGGTTPMYFETGAGKFMPGRFIYDITGIRQAAEAVTAPGTVTVLTDTYSVIGNFTG